MKNNNLGYGKFEVLTVIVVLLGIGAFLGYTILGIGNNDSSKFKTMRKDADSFARTVINNLNDGDREVFTLAEVIDEGLFTDVINPFGEGNCDIFESRVEMPGTSRLLTFKCGDYIINDGDIKAGKYDIYKVSNWKETATDENSISAEVYNCKEGEKLLFEDYLEADSFVYALRKTNGVDVNNIDEAKAACNVDVKTMYRDLELIDEDN